jgi:hypothetical protein
MFADTDQKAKAMRDPVAPAKRSKAALAKAARHTLDDGTTVHSFSTLLAELATIVSNTCPTPQAGPHALMFEVLTTPSAKQRRALELIQQIRCRQNPEPRSHAKCLSRKTKLARRLEELRVSCPPRLPVRASAPSTSPTLSLPFELQRRAPA